MNDDRVISRDAQRKWLETNVPAAGEWGTHPSLQTLTGLDSDVPQSVQEMQSQDKHNTGNRTNCAQNKSIHPETSQRLWSAKRVVMCLWNWKYERTVKTLDEENILLQTEAADSITSIRQTHSSLHNIWLFWLAKISLLEASILLSMWGIKFSCHVSGVYHLLLWVCIWLLPTLHAHYAFYVFALPLCLISAQSLKVAHIWSGFKVSD